MEGGLFWGLLEESQLGLNWESHARRTFLDVRKLEAHSILIFPPKVISELANTVKGETKIQSWLDWQGH